MYKNYEGVNVRLNFGHEDFIRYYHRDLNKIWLQVMDNYQYKVYPAAHSTCGLGDMFEFIMKTFENPPAKPLKWNHIDVYPTFSVWDYDVSSDRDVPGFTILENVDKRGFRCSVREHLPDGEILPFVSLSVTTPPIYEKNTQYTINDDDINNLKVNIYTLKSDSAGRLTICFNGKTHEIGINRGSDKPNICIASLTFGNPGFAVPNKEVILKIKLLNKGVATAEGMKATLSAMRKSALVIHSQADYGSLSSNESAESKSSFTFRVQSDTIEIEKFLLTISDKNNNEWKSYFEVPVIKEPPEIIDFEIADGRTVTVAKEGTGSEMIVLGSGNGDGIANPGESIVILVKDLNKLWRTSLVTDDRNINPFGTSIRMSDNWGSYDHVGGSAKYSVPVISSDCAPNHIIDFIAEYWLPDNPNHIIKQGKISVKITGKDLTPPQLVWVRIPGDNVIQAKLYDGSRITNVKARMINKNKPDKSFDIELKDDGRNGDKVENDNVFSYSIPEQRFGLFNVEITATDSYGNVMTKRAPEIFVIH
jgi:hypothetical protein